MGAGEGTCGSISQKPQSDRVRAEQKRLEEASAAYTRSYIGFEKEQYDKALIKLGEAYKNVADQTEKNPLLDFRFPDEIKKRDVEKAKFAEGYREAREALYAIANEVTRVIGSTPNLDRDNSRAFQGNTLSILGILNDSNKEFVDCAKGGKRIKFVEYIWRLTEDGNRLFEDARLLVLPGEAGKTEATDPKDLKALK